MSDKVEVVAAIIIKDGRILLAQRGALQNYPGCWCIPGGKAIEGEKHDEALRREIYEEIKCSFDLKGTGAFARIEREAFNITYYRVQPRAYVFTVDNEECAGVGWFTIEQMAELELTPGDRAVLPSLENLM
jgi:ADP-ribose pyrophosphatase YjhB (NUDIX family)